LPHPPPQALAGLIERPAPSLPIHTAYSPCLSPSLYPAHSPTAYPPQQALAGLIERHHGDRMEVAIVDVWTSYTGWPFNSMVRQYRCNHCYLQKSQMRSILSKTS
jgi:hypothetical protein